MIKYTVGIDLDGVIWDLVGPWLNYYNDITNENIRVEDIKSYNLQKYVKWPETLFYILDEREDLWDKVNLYNDVEASIIKLLTDERIDFQIVTSTSYKTAKPKIKRLFSLLPALKEEHITLTTRKDLLKLNFLVDDYEKNLNIENVDFPILITKEYNKDFDTYNNGITRRDSLENAVNTILNIINQLEEERR